MFHYPSIENHYDQKHMEYWLQRHPELNTIQLVAQQKYDGSNLGIEFVEDDRISFFSRNNLLVDTDKFFGLTEVIRQDKYAIMLDTIKQWKSTQTEIKTINLFGEFYGPGIQKRINYGTEKQIKFFDVYFNGKILSVSRFTQWMEDLKLTDFMVETLLTGTLDELINSLEKCQSLVQHPIEGIVIKVLDSLQNANRRFCIKVKVKGFEDIDRVKAKKIKAVNNAIETSRGISDFITENRIQDCRGKQPWIDVGDLIKRVLEDAFNDFKKNESNKDENANTAELTPNERKLLSKKAMHICQKLYNPKTGEHLPQ